MIYRQLTESEVRRLERQKCRAESWDNVWVADHFSTDYLEHVTFSGVIRLGVFNNEFLLPGGVKKHAGLRFVTLHNVTVGDNCYIGHVQGYVANYQIGHDTFIEHVDALYVKETSRFGNGVEVSVLNETGGREVLINDKLSAHLAYIMTCYRHRPKLIARLRELARHYADKYASPIGTIGHHVTIRHAGTLRSIRVGDRCTIDGAARLSNGTIHSNEAAPVYVGRGVMADDFIICSGSRVDDGTMLTRCFVGQACKLGHGYTASDSLFFSNCHGENGEACAIFAGPFTVTHHKSTLLIAGMFSFMNAGSGSNQSNHMYKLGPIHQGTLERGAKTTSDSYILWPARVGAYSLVMGRHVTHSDTANLPFSYLIEQNNTTYLVPGINLRSVGTIRDARKWPKRDGRTDPHRLDFINYNLLTPYTVQKMLKGRELLQQLRQASGELSDLYSYHSTKIRNSSLQRGVHLYELAIHKFLGNSVLSRLQGVTIRNNEELRTRLLPDTPIGSGEWVDLAGLIAPKSEVEVLLDAIECGKVSRLKYINAAFERMHTHYNSYEWTWTYGQLAAFYGFRPEEATVEDIIRVVEKWKEAVLQLDQLLYEDARKEFSLASMTGFGADGSHKEQERDFEQVRGDFENNPFVREILEHMEAKARQADELLERLRSVHPQE